MLNTALNKSDIKYLLEQQGKLDESMREQLNISDENWEFNMQVEHLLALNVEIHEFINSCHKSWKYWKRKEMNMDDVLDEAIDVIHFCMLNINKLPHAPGFLYGRIERQINTRKPLEDRDHVKLIMFDMTSGESVLNKLCGVLQILDYYGYTTKDVIDQYNAKNKENFRRLASGY